MFVSIVVSDRPRAGQWRHRGSAALARGIWIWSGAPGRGEWRSSPSNTCTRYSSQRYNSAHGTFFLFLGLIAGILRPPCPRMALENGAAGPTNLWKTKARAPSRSRELMPEIWPHGEVSTVLVPYSSIAVHKANKAGSPYHKASIGTPSPAVCTPTSQEEAGCSPLNSAGSWPACWPCVRTCGYKPAAFGSRHGQPSPRAGGYPDQAGTAWAVPQQGRAGLCACTREPIRPRPPGILRPPAEGRPRPSRALGPRGAQRGFSSCARARCCVFVY